MTKKLFITVDTECHDIDNQDRYIWGQTSDGEYWGVKKILEIGKSENIPINFFVDIAEADRYGLDFIKSIVDLIQSYNQHIYMHLHPNYISGDETRTYLWQYTSEEQKTILKRAHEIWKTLFPDVPCVAFRAGRYGVNAELYDYLKEEFGNGLIDLSYCAPGGKMCHLSKGEIGVDNGITEYKGIVLIPNTRYIALKPFPKVLYMNVDAAETCMGEFKQFIKKNKLSNAILTMHSWNFIKTFYFKKGFVGKDRSAERRFIRMVRYAKNNEYVFCDIMNDGITNDTNDVKDQLIDLCDSFTGKIKSLWYNFVRFQRMARLSKKYLVVYSLFYCVLVLVALFILITIIRN